MRIVFMGTPGFAVACLRALVENGCTIVGVVTSADQPAGRGLQMSGSAVKEYALQQGLKVLQPEKLRDEAFLTQLRQLNADLQIVVAFRMLPEVVWNMPPHGTYNLHASLLPYYRGAAPINWAIINGEKETGVCTFKLKHEIDTGNILFTEKVDIGETTTAGKLHDHLMEKGAQLLVKTVQAVAASVDNQKKLVFIKQDEMLGSHAPKLFRETCRINWNKPAHEIHNLIRGLSPYPAAYTILKDVTGIKTLKIYEAWYEENVHEETNGSVITDNKTFIKVVCPNGWLLLNTLQIEGKRRMNVEEFLKGRKLGLGACMI